MKVMRLTPIEISQHKFNVRFRGFDKDEVHALLAMVVADFEEVVRENAQLRREAERLGRELDTHLGRERTIQETLTTAQGVVEQMQRAASKDSEQIIVDAELRCEKMVAEARQQCSDLTHNIAELHHLRERLDGDLRNVLESYLKMVDAFDEARHDRKMSSVDPSYSNKADTRAT
ncbi:MAG: DivIVA domain-containing protein [bacterium]|nr:DivIVA domain-containing protein [bacterium]